MAMSEAAREARAAYKREWYARNKDKQKEYTERYWARKAAEGDSGRKNSEDCGKGAEC